ncbi:hypothetical protein K493DRAFT_319163 [Basidiobolus meristosporus CBS 931.73]|uniref:RPA43 OB domain-containing protein n=1 Tax=Basidiobolus meristosporus CBS 931.73 TaxID=1314790 RepID=A0A1Y1XTL9_9FUNG|nr:hypothetical protein K493DRAFT_319163 [Basidiobolus meristosporus CBS 931.73]|eukprot:ORX88846.1 hypothetical protein K493DRAFT_319163 [Basidiobolus meristosporus CBS 931.73]
MAKRKESVTLESSPAVATPSKKQKKAKKSKELSEEIVSLETENVDQPEAPATPTKKRTFFKSPIPITKPYPDLERNNASASPFAETCIKMYITLPPCFCNNPLQGINEQLNSFLMRYVPQVDGIVLAHSDLQILEKTGRIMYDSPYSHFWITVNLLIWKPKKGIKLVGIINLQSQDHIGLLLYNTFNASIPAECIPKTKYEWRQETTEASESEEAPVTGEWVFKHNGTPIGTDGWLEFTVEDLVKANDMITVSGSLIPTEEAPQDVGETPANKKRHAEQDGDKSTKKKKKAKKI